MIVVKARLYHWNMFCETDSAVIWPSVCHGDCVKCWLRFLQTLLLVSSPTKQVRNNNKPTHEQSHRDFSTPTHTLLFFCCVDNSIISHFIAVDWSRMEISEQLNNRLNDIVTCGSNRKWNKSPMGRTSIYIFIKPCLRKKRSCWEIARWNVDRKWFYCWAELVETR